MKVIWIIGGTVLAGLLLGFWASGRLFDSSHPVPAQSPLEAMLTPSAPPPAEPPLLPERSSPRPNPRLLRLRPPSVFSTDSTNWEDRVEAILVSDEDNDVKVREMLELFPTLPADGQVEVAEQADALLADQDYGILAPFTTNSTLAAPVLETLLSGLMTRPDSIRLPLLFTIAGDDEHPESDQAGELLNILMTEAYGTNWWQSNDADADPEINAPSANQGTWFEIPR